MSRNRVHFLAVNQDLHALDGRQIGGDRIDDRVDGEELGEGATRMNGNAAEVDEGIALVRDIERAERRSSRDGGDVWRGRSGGSSCRYGARP